MVGRFALVAVLGLTLSSNALGQFQATDLRVLPKEVEYTPNQPVVTCYGQWQAEQVVGISTIAKVNSVKISCDKRTMKCHESIAMVTTPADGLATSGMLAAVLFEYDVKTWGTVIEASGATRATNLTLTINLDKATVLRTSTETDERGARTSDQTTHRWVLR